jgi:hypothetical protein
MKALPTHMPTWLNNSAPASSVATALAHKLHTYLKDFGLIDNSRALQPFDYAVRQLLLKWLNRRSQRRSCSWASLGWARQAAATEKHARRSIKGVLMRSRIVQHKSRSMIANAAWPVPTTST